MAGASYAPLSSTSLVNSVMLMLMLRSLGTDCSMLLLQVLHIHVFLGVQDILCVWIYAACLHHTSSCHRLCYHRMHLLPA